MRKKRWVMPLMKTGISFFTDHTMLINSITGIYVSAFCTSFNGMTIMYIFPERKAQIKCWSERDQNFLPDWHIIYRCLQKKSIELFLTTVNGTDTDSNQIFSHIKSGYLFRYPLFCLCVSKSVFKAPLQGGLVLFFAKEAIRTSYPSAGRAAPFLPGISGECRSPLWWCPCRG